MEKGSFCNGLIFILSRRENGMYKMGTTDVLMNLNSRCQLDTCKHNCIVITCVVEGKSIYSLEMLQHYPLRAPARVRLISLYKTLFLE
jgi:hypothetical protein